MNLVKPNDMLVTSMDNPDAPSSELLNQNFNGDNTSLLSADQYKQTDYVQKSFTSPDGNFNSVAFNDAYDNAKKKYTDVTNMQFLNGLDTIEYSPFDTSRPINAKTYNVAATYSPDINPTKEYKGWSGIGSIDDNPLSMRELAQQNKVYDPETKTWSKESLNDFGIFDKLFGSTLVYAQWDSDGVAVDPATGQMVKHSKGDWKYDENGNVYAEKLGNGSAYGKQVVSPTDILTTDGSFFNKFDFMDSDGRSKSIVGTMFKTAASIAPYLIKTKNIGNIYAGIGAAVGLIEAMPGLYNSFNGIVNGSNSGKAPTLFDSAASYFAKYSSESTSDEGQQSMFNIEQLGHSVASTIDFIYQQRAVASLSQLVKTPKQIALDAKLTEMNTDIQNNFQKYAMAYDMGIEDKALKLTPEQLSDIQQHALSEIPGLADLQKQQSAISKAISLGYMSLTAGANVYNDAKEHGYNDRVAGFAALASMAAQYGVMANDRLGDWFLDKTTGYNENSNNFLIKKAVGQLYGDINDSLGNKFKEVKMFGKIKDTLTDAFLNPSELGASIMKNTVQSGEMALGMHFTDQAVKGMFDTLSYLGLTKGSFGGLNNIFGKEALKDDLTQLVGGLVGGPVFALAARNEGVLSRINKKDRINIYQLVANNQGNDLIREIDKNRDKLGNKYLTPDGESIDATDGKSQSDFIADTSINMIKNIQGLMGTEGLLKTNNDIVARAFRNQYTANELTKLKGDSKIGIEGIALSDYMDNVDKLIALKDQMSKLDPSDVNSKELANALNKEASLYRNNINDILSGNRALDYYSQGLFYLSKGISSKFVNIDRDTFSKNTTGKSYYSLDDSQKLDLDNNWNNYIKSRDLNKDLIDGYASYKEFEKQMMPVISDYVTSGYSKERDKTNKNVLDIAKTMYAFNTSNDREAAINNYIAIAKRIEKTTGERISPYDLIRSNMADDLIDGGYLSTSNFGDDINLELNKVVGKNNDGSDITKKDILSSILNDSISRLPADVNDYGALRGIFKSAIEQYNKSLDDQMSKTDDESRIHDLENRKMNFELYDPKQKEEDLKSYYDRIINEKYGNIGQRYGKNLPTDEIISRKQNEGNIDRINSLLKVSDKLYNSIDKTDISNEIKASALQPKQKTRLLEAINDKSKFLNILSENEGRGTKKIIDVLHFRLNDEIKNIQNYNSSIDARNRALISNIDKIKNFMKTNRLFDIIEKEILSGNHDKELVNLLHESYSKSLSNIQASSFGKLFSNVDTIIKNAQIISSLENEIPNNKIGEDLFEFAHKLRESCYFEGNKQFNDEQDPMEYSAPKIQYDLVNEDGESLSSILKQIETAYKEYYNKPNPKEFEHPELIDKLEKLVSAQISLGKISNNFDLSTISRYSKIITNGSNYVSNSIYDFLSKQAIKLNDGREMTIFDILKNEEFALNKASDITEYLSDGINDKSIQKAIDIINLLESPIEAMSTNRVGFDKSYGFVQARIDFAKKNGLDSDGLIAIDSSEAGTMIMDLERIKNKLSFLKELMLSNSGKTFVEQETIRKKTNDLILDKLSKVNKVIPNFDITDILNGNASTESKLYEIEKRINSLNYNDILKYISTLKFNNDCNELVNSDNLISKNISQLSDHDFMYYLLANNIINPTDWNIRMKELLSSDIDKAPFFTQEFVTKIAYAFIQDPNKFNIHIDGTNPLLTSTNNILSVLGDGGTGKTSVIFKNLNILLGNNNEHLNVIYSAPNKEQVERLNSSANIQSMNSRNMDKVTLFKYLLGESNYQEINDKLKGIYSTDKLSSGIISSILDKVDLPNDLPDIIYIDEITNYGTHELFVLNELVNKCRESGKQIRIVTAGDPTQRGYTYDGLSRNIDATSSVFTPRMSMTVRSMNNQKRKNNDFLASLAKQSRLWTNASDDKMIYDKIGNGIPFNYYISNNELHGDMVVSDINDQIINTLKEIKKNNPNAKIGIIGDNSLKDKIGIDDIKIYTPDNVQGDEVDYFIFPISSCDGKTLPSKIRNLYTFVTRAKNGSIIIDDANLGFRLLSNKEDYTRNIEPINEGVISESKDKRLSEINKLITPDDKITNDTFKFIPIEQILTPVTKFDDEQKEIPTSETDDNKIDIDDSKLMGHTFYNDLNAEISENGDKIVINPNPNGFYGISKKHTLSEKSFSDLVNSLIKLKYSIMDHLIGSKKALPQFEYNGNIIKEEGQLVIRKSEFDNKYNKPFAKQYGDSKRFLNNGDKYLNLFYKVKDINGNDNYIHLATLPRLDTVADNIKGGKNSKTYKSLEDMINSPNDEFNISKENINFISGTRIIKNPDNIEKKEYTLNDLSNKMLFPGLTFYDSNTKSYSDSPKISYYTKNDIKEFEEVFGNSKLFDIMVNNPIVIVSFGGKINPIILKSKTRSLNDVIGLIEDNKLSDMFKGSKVDKASALNLANSLFSPNQSLEMLIDLAIDRPDDYKNLMTKTSELLNKEINQNDQSDDLKDILYYIKQSIQTDLNKVLRNESVVESTSKFNTSLPVITSHIYDLSQTIKDRKELKRQMIDYIHEQRLSYWNRDFWKIFSINHKIGNVIDLTDDDTKKSILNVLHTSINNAIDYWSDRKLYYNVPLSYDKNGKSIVYNTDGNMLFTNLVPEGPRLLIDFNKIDSSNKIEEIKQPTIAEKPIEVPNSEPIEIPKSDPVKDNLSLALKAPAEFEEHYLDAVNSFGQSSDMFKEMLSSDMNNGLNNVLIDYCNGDLTKLENITHMIFDNVIDENGESIDVLQKNIDKIDDINLRDDVEMNLYDTLQICN